MDHFMKRIQQVHPAVFCSWDLHSNAAVHKAASVCHFWPKKMLQPFITPPPGGYSPELSLPDYFIFPKLKMKLKGLHFADVAEIQEAITDELK